MSASRALPLTLRHATTAGLTKFHPSAGRFGLIQTRYAATESLSTTEGNALLAKQRLQRPVAPHLSIYRPQITWYGSAFHRISGTILSGSLYVFGLSYLAAPALGWHLESQSLVAAMASLPVVVKVAAKAVLSFPLTFHCINGVRHLVWDTGKGYAVKTIVRSAWVVTGLSVLSSVYLAFL